MSKWAFTIIPVCPPMDFTWYCQIRNEANLKSCFICRTCPCLESDTGGEARRMRAVLTGALQVRSFERTLNVRVCKVRTDDCALLSRRLWTSSWHGSDGTAAEMTSPSLCRTLLWSRMLHQQPWVWLSSDNPDIVDNHRIHGQRNVFNTEQLPASFTSRLRQSEQKVKR